MDDRKALFEARYSVILAARLGYGRDGDVYVTSTGNAVKFFDRVDGYSREIGAYFLLKERGISTILGHHVPELIDFDDELLAIEMSIVKRPFLLDFASAYLEDEAPDFSEEVWDDWTAQLMERFGSNYPKVIAIREALRLATGLVLMDINPGNIGFADEQ